MTYRSLLAFEVGGVPLVDNHCYRLHVAPRAMGLCSRSFFGCALLQFLDYCNRWQNHCTCHCSTITITSTYEVVADAVIFRSHFIRHITIKTNTKLPWVNSKILITENIIRDYKEYHKLKRRCLKNFIHCTNAPENKNFYIRFLNTPGNRRIFLYSLQKYSRKGNWPKNTPENNKT